MNILEKLKQNRAIVIIGVMALVAALLLLILSGNRKQSEIPSDSDILNQPSPTPVIIVPTDSFTPEQLETIEEQRTTDEKVAVREREIKTKYPWFVKLPLRGSNYFVYFDQNRAIFIGRLYPKATDDVEMMKADVKQRLRDQIGITDVDTYVFEWVELPE